MVRAYLMDCDEVRELLDVYAVGAAEPAEAAAIEAHVADCVRCWSTLNEAQRVAASLALGGTIQRSPEPLRRRVLAEASRAETAPAEGGSRGVRQWLGHLWPVGAGVLTAAAAASLAFTFVLQGEVSDLQDENDQLESQVEAADQSITDQQQVMAVLAAADARQVEMTSVGETSGDVWGSYLWSSRNRTGVILCDNLPPLGSGEVYKVWLLTDASAYEMTAFDSWSGAGYFELGKVSVPETEDRVGIGLSIDDADARRPGELVLRAEFPE
jgi:hypothetical protein